MKNLEVYNGDSLDFFKDVVKRKRNPKDDPTYKARLTNLDLPIEGRYLEYDEKYEKDDLQSIPMSVYTEQQGDDMLSLYKFSSKAMVDLRIKLTTTKNKIVSDTCHNCTISEINSFDHYLPKEKYPEFAVHPKNLIPSCTVCNGHKGDNWQIDGKRIFISPYLDILPDLQFLFVEVSATENDMDVKFTIDNPFEIDATLYEIVETHYRKLFLCERFVRNCATIIEEIKTEMLNYSKRLNLKDLKETIIECAIDNRQVFGFNHFKYLLTIALVQHEDFVHQYVGLPKSAAETAI
jgi:5-methylcytosine-specific restriction endonuclease McrA